MISCWRRNSKRLSAKPFPKVVPHCKPDAIACDYAKWQRSGMKKGMLGVGAMILLGLLALVVLVFLWAIGMNNKIVRKSTAVDARWADVQNVYQRRADLIPNLVKTVEGAAGFERTTLNEVVGARAAATQTKIDVNRAPDDPQQLQKFQAAQDALSGALSRLLVVVERYPDLKANRNFQELQAQLE